MIPQQAQSREQVPSYQHASAEEYTTFVHAYTTNTRQRQHLLSAQSRFVRYYPDLNQWFAAPLTERTGRLYGEDKDHPSYRASYEGRRYLMFLALHGYIQFDWEWLLAAYRLDFTYLLNYMGVSLKTEQLIEEAVALGYNYLSAANALHWMVGRLFLHTGISAVEQIEMAHLREFSEALRLFGEREDLALFHGSKELYHLKLEHYTCHLYLLHVVLYQRGQVNPELHRPRSVPQRLVLKPGMEATVTQYLNERRLTAQPRTVEGIDSALHQFIRWLARTYPEMETVATVTREHLLEYAESLNTTPSQRTGQPINVVTKRGILSRISVFFQDVARWQWNDVPDRPLLQVGDLPKLPQRVPRYIPDEELARMMNAIRSLPCPYHRAALLVARWSGARRGEIRRLSLDCLDSYPDGTPKLRIPTGKTYKERVVPLHQEAAAAIRLLQEQQTGERGFRDPSTGEETRYLFVCRGHLLSYTYLFDTPLQQACAQAGLVKANGMPSISAHRFRHTVGTQLARRKARMRTIMKILGHTSAGMTMRYLDITDEEVLADYLSALEPGAPIAGLAAELLRSGSLSASDIDWLKCNFFKTELELGHCLRLPAEGPCECDLYLFCTKFLTTRQKAPRLRHRRKVELLLAEDAASHGWMAEVGRHHRFAERCEELLIDLGEPIDGPEAAE
jgi:integrase